MVLGHDTKLNNSEIEKKIILCDVTYSWNLKTNKPKLIEIETPTVIVRAKGGLGRIGRYWLKVTNFQAEGE